MFGIDASGNIAPMKHEESFWDVPIVNIPGDTVRSQGSATMPTGIDCPIPEVHFGSSPEPTTLGFIDEFPKSHFDGSWFNSHTASMPSMCFHNKGNA